MANSKKTFIKLHERYEYEIQKSAIISLNIKSILINECSVIFNKYRIKSAILFGTVLNGTCTEKSDIDLMISPIGSEEYYSIQRELEGILNRQIDLHTMDEDAVFVNKIKARGEIIYEA